MAASQTQPTRISILLRLYPHTWRARYADEFTALLADTTLTPAKVLDIAVGALDARWSGDYPSAAGDHRKVRRPMVDRLAAFLTAAGGAYFAAFMLLVLVAEPAEGSAPYYALLYGIPIAMASITIGIGGLSLGWLGGDGVARGLGIISAVAAAGITIAILYLYFLGDLGMNAVDLLLPAFAVATGLVGARIVSRHRDWLPGLLLSAGWIAAAAWLIALFGPGDASANPVTFGLVMLAWGLVGLLRLRPSAQVVATA